MNAKFFDLKQEKQDRMINAALKVFALNGYQHASTDDIVKEAHISKGLLFHYFDSKIGVYTFIYDYCVRYMTLELSTAIDPSETSYMEIRRQMEAAKMQCLKTYPYLQMFLNSCKHEEIAEAALAIESTKASYENSIGTILARADYSGLKSVKEYDKYLKIMDYTLDGIMEDRFRDGSFNAEMLYEESVKYISLIEKAFL